jgi:hypothetical protein
MTPDDYQRLAMRTEADQKVILDRLTFDTGYYVRAMRLMNAVIGLNDDCGEISGCIKRHVEYGQKLDTVNLLEEVGDVLWRLAQICHGAGFTMEQAMEANLAKLQKRYPEKYSDFNAAEENRPRDSERQAVESVHGQ